MNNQKLILLITFIILVCLVWKNDIIQRPILLLPLIVGFLLIFSIINNDNVEHMTNEAISNCSSLFNGGNGTVKDLTVTGEIKLPNGWKISNDGHIRFYKDGNLKGFVDASGNVGAVANLTAANGTKTAFYNGDGSIKIGTWTIKDAGEIQFLKDGGGYAVFRASGDLWTQPSGSFKDDVDWKNFVISGKGGKRNGDKGHGWNAKCGPTTTPGGCTDLCPDGYYMSGISTGKEWDHKHPVCTKFT
jgi:hypothetical protein